MSGKPRAAGLGVYCGSSLQVLFALHDKTLLSGMELDGVTTCSIEPIHTGSSKVDIFLELFEARDGSVVGHIEYDSSLWQRSSVQALSAAFSVSLSCVQPQRFVSTCTCPACMHAVVSGLQKFQLVDTQLAGLMGTVYV